MQEIRPKPLQHQIRIKAEIEAMPEAQDFILGILRQAGAPEKYAMKMRLVLDEAVANAIEHGGTKSGLDFISVSCQLMNGSFQLQVEDYQGRMFDPEYFRRIAVVKDWGKGGRGILLLESLVDHMMYLIEVGKHTILYMEVAAPWHESAQPRLETAPPAARDDVPGT